MKARSIAAAVEQAGWFRSWNRARSPLTRTCRNRSASSVPRAEDAAHPLRVLEADQARLRQRVDGDDARAPLLRPLERREHPRVVGARVLADDDQQVGGLDVVERDRPLADADRLGEGDAARLVAHVRAVGQVVGAEPAGQQLVEERGLVARAARRVERGLVGRVERRQPVGDDADGLVPRHRFVAVGAGPLHHGDGEPALLAEPVVGPLAQVGERVGGEELGVDPPERGLLGDRLGAVLAELEVAAVRRARARRSRGSRSPPTWLTSRRVAMLRRTRICRRAMPSPARTPGQAGGHPLG